MVKVNGKDEDIVGENLLRYLQKKEYKIDRIAVEINEKIISKQEYENYTIQDADRIEIVAFVGGG